LPGLEKEKITANNLAAAYDTITESLLRQAVVKGSQAQIEQLVAETAKEIIALRLKEKKAVDDAAEAYKKQQNAAKPDESAQSKFDRYVQSVEQGNGVIRDGAIALQNQKVVQDQAIRSVNIYDVLVKQLTQDLKNQLQPLMSLTTEFSDLDTNIKNTSKDSENLITRAKALAKELAKIGAVVPEFSETQTKAQQEQIAKDFIARFKGAKLEFNVTPIIKADKIEMPPLTDGGGMSQAEKQAEKDGAILGQAFIDGRNKVLTTGFILTPEALKARNIQAAIEAAIKLGKDGAQAVNEAINSIKLEGLFSIGEALGAAFSGGEIKNVFQSFVTAISSAIVALGKQLVTLGIAAKVTKDALKTLFSNPIAMVAAGVGLIAVGSAIRGALSKGIEGREKGGPVTGNTPYIVGERGPELFVPSVGGSIIPNNRMSSFTGRPAFAMGGGGGRTIIRGNDILLASARTQRSQNRVNA
jgi:hypothetical protein